MDDQFPNAINCRPGFRLHKLEVYNWGTFDSTNGSVHLVRPNGQTALLVGQNESGKSTLVDAMLTLLVRPGTRNYNVAAGGHKQDRDERSYIKGAYGRSSRDEDNRGEVRFLRPKGSHYSALLACFYNEDVNQLFTVAVILYLTGDGSVDKVYCIAPSERSIAEDLGGFKNMERLRQQIEKRGFRATKSYTEYYSWFMKMTGVRPKAMDIFNQTVAVKDIQSLNRFIREHMLEAKPWGEKVASLLSHFTQLSEAHQSLVRVRRQGELLEPVAQTGAEYREQASQLDRLQRILAAADTFFRQKSVDILIPASDALHRDLESLAARKGRLGQELAEKQEECRRLKNEIEQAGGERLRQIPLLIQNHQSQADMKRTSNQRYHEALREAGIPQEVLDQSAFAAVQAKTPLLLCGISEQLAKDSAERDALVGEYGSIRATLRESESELRALAQRQSNLPEWTAVLRRNLCADLGLSERDLPFAAEIISVKPEERAWEPSIEMVLRGFALSLLVPQRYYHIVSRYVDAMRVADSSNRGQRLVYLRVGERTGPSRRSPLHGQSLLRKLVYREGNPLLPWVKAELEERFDFLCCDTLDEFETADGLAMTRNRHVKYRGVRHEKDDRDKMTDPRYFVLGWDNREKRRHLTEEITRLTERRDQLERRIAQVEQQATYLRVRAAALTRVQEFTDFGEIDFAAHEREIAELRREKKTMENGSDAIRILKQRLEKAETAEKGLQDARDLVIGEETACNRQLEEYGRLITNAQKILKERKADGTLLHHAESFADLEAWFTDRPLAPATLFDQEGEFKEARRAEIERLRQAIEPLKTKVTNLMIRFLRDFPGEREDLEPHVDYLDSFLELWAHIAREDLPRHEQRFKERLNEKVTHEIGLLNAALRTERNEIESKIKLLNESLRQLEYRPGTFMQLEPKPVRDAEIADFQNSLNECLAGTFEGTLEADEARYLRIEKLITKLREEQRWQEKVTDVRRWFDFVAREIDSATGGERAYYEDSAGQSGGAKAKLAFTILVAAIAYQYDIPLDRPTSSRFHFVVVDEMFAKVDDQYADYALRLFQKFGLQLLIVAPLDAKACVTQPYVGSYIHVVKDVLTNQSEAFSMTARDFEEVVVESAGNHRGNGSSRRVVHPR
jgi:uncharacterized protein YPO0396